MTNRTWAIHHVCLDITFSNCTKEASAGSLQRSCACGPLILQLATTRRCHKAFVKTRLFKAFQGIAFRVSKIFKGLMVAEREPNELPDLCGCATDETFLERSDLDKLHAETQRILEDRRML